MIYKCPGSAGIRQPEPEDVTCPSCGAEMEIWTDEAKAPCPSCKKHVPRSGGLTSCLDWCAQAEKCAGKETYLKYLENKNAWEKSKG